MTPPRCPAGTWGQARREALRPHGGRGQLCWMGWRGAPAASKATSTQLEGCRGSEQPRLHEAVARAGRPPGGCGWMGHGCRALGEPQHHSPQGPAGPAPELIVNRRWVRWHSLSHSRVYIELNTH